MSKKRVKGVLKGVAGIGAAIGGANAFTDADTVYAHEAENLDQTEEVTEEKEQEDVCGGAQSTAPVEFTLDSESTQTPAESQAQVTAVSEANSESAVES